MKISIKDPFVNVAVRNVFINGERLTNCIMADDELGEVEVYLIEKGAIVCIGAGEAMTIKRKGKVVIDLHPDWEFVGGQLRMAKS